MHSGSFATRNSPSAQFCTNMQATRLFPFNEMPSRSVFFHVCKLYVVCMHVKPILILNYNLLPREQFPHISAIQMLNKWPGCVFTKYTCARPTKRVVICVFFSHRNHLHHLPSFVHIKIFRCLHRFFCRSPSLFVLLSLQLCLCNLKKKKSAQIKYMGKTQLPRHFKLLLKTIKIVQ